MHEVGEKLKSKYGWNLENLLDINWYSWSTHEHRQIVNTKIRLIIFFAAEDKQSLTVEQK